MVCSELEGVLYLDVDEYLNWIRQRQRASTQTDDHSQNKKEDIGYSQMLKY